MSKVYVQMSMSVDGIAGASDPSEFFTVHNAVLGWVFGLESWRRKMGMEGGVDNADSRLVQELFDRPGAYLMGRTMFDFGEEPWGENPPFGVPVYVVTHREREPLERLGGTTFSFVTDGIAAAIEQAKAAAGGKDVQISGGIQLARAAIAAGLVDELVLHVSPVIIGDGERLLDQLGLGGQYLALTATGAVAGETGAVHLTYDVSGVREVVNAPGS